MPTLNRSACAIEFQQASTVCAESVRPPSKMVNEAITGSRIAVVVEVLLDGEQAGLEHERVEGRLGQQNIDAAFDQRIDLLVVRLDHLVERGVAVAGIVDVAGDRELLVRRTDRAGDEPRPVGGSQIQLVDRTAGDLTAARFSSRTSDSKPKSAIATLVAPNVLVSMMSAPASRYWR